MALAFGVGPLLACASTEPKIVPLCSPLESLQPLPATGSCDDPALGEYTSSLSDRIIGRGGRALVRVEFDGAARVRSVCVEDGVGSHAWSSRRDLEPKIDAILSQPPGPGCLADKRLDLNRYEAKLAEIDQARIRCERQVGYRARALQRCLEFDADWIVLDRVGSTRVYLFVVPEVANPPDLSASETASRCARTTHRFESESECIQADGWELLTPPPR